MSFSYPMSLSPCTLAEVADNHETIKPSGIEVLFSDQIMSTRRFIGHCEGLVT